MDEKTAYSVWFFGRESHFGNFLSRDGFTTLAKAKGYARKTMDEVSEAYDLYDGNWGEGDDAFAESVGMPAKEFKEKWQMDGYVPGIWLLDHADTVRIVKDGNANGIKAEWQATYDSDGDFKGWVCESS